LETPVVRVLVVDDYEPFRRFVGSTLRQIQGMQVIGEAADGLDAVRKAEELNPDLIVLDIGLPTLSGIEVTRRIRKLRPECKILFMSQESSPDVAQAAFSLGATGYVVKAHAGSELLPAVEAVCKGRYFVSKGLSAHNWPTGAQTPGPLFLQGVPRSPVSDLARIKHRHEVQFYPDDSAFLLGLACFSEAAFSAGNPVIVIATESRRKSLLETLLARGTNNAAAIEQGLYLSFDVYEALSTFMANDLPDPARFRKVFESLLSSTARTAKADPARIAACGEIAPTLLAQGKAEAAIQVEHLTDELARIRNVDVLCGYVLSSSQREQGSGVYERICAEHSAVQAC
jgi:CheY-like chemotaxis protein